MTSLARAFLAVQPPAEVVDEVAARLAPARRLPAGERLRWTRRDQWHLTLRFCGRVPDADLLIDTARDALRDFDAVTGLRVVGAGAFPKSRHGSVLWVGTEPGSATDALARIALVTDAACVSAGLAPEDRPFRPHLTVARAARACDLRPLVAAFGPEAVGPPWSADSVVLMASDTRPDGAVHEEITRFPLRG